MNDFDITKLQTEPVDTARGRGSISARVERIDAELQTATSPLERARLMREKAMHQAYLDATADGVPPAPEAA